MLDSVHVRNRINELLDENDTFDYVSQAVFRFCKKGSILLIGDILHVIRHGEIVNNSITTRPEYPKYQIVGDSPNSGEQELSVWIVLSIQKDDNRGIKIVSVDWHRAPAVVDSQSE